MILVWMFLLGCVAGAGVMAIVKGRKQVPPYLALLDPDEVYKVQCEKAFRRARVAEIRVFKALNALRGFPTEREIEDTSL